VNGGERATIPPRESTIRELGSTHGSVTMATRSPVEATEGRPQALPRKTGGSMEPSKATKRSQIVGGDR